MRTAKPEPWPLEHDRRFNHPLLVLLAVPFGAISIYRGVTLDHAWELVVGIALVVTCIPPLVLILAEQRRDQSFRAWVLEHAAEIRAGTATLDGVRVSADTDLVAYRVFIALVAFSIAEWSRFVLPGTPAEALTRRRSTIITAICGWWLPFSGPSRTLETIGLNRTAGPGVVMPLGMILDLLERGQPLGHDDVTA